MWVLEGEFSQTKVLNECCHTFVSEQIPNIHFTDSLKLCQ